MNKIQLKSYSYYKKNNFYLKNLLEYNLSEEKIIIILLEIIENKEMKFCQNEYLNSLDRTEIEINVLSKYSIGSKNE